MSFNINMGPCSFCSNPAKLGQGKACVECAVIYDKLCIDSSQHKCSKCGGGLDVVDNVYPHNLFSAIKIGDLEAVEYLAMTSSANINEVRDKNGNTVLSAAIRSKADKGNVVAKRLISLGASIKATDKLGRTALIHAAIGRHLSVALAELLWNSVDCSDCDGKTALMFAAEGQSSTNGRTGSMSMAKLIVSMGADVLACSKRGRTALGYAIDSNDTGTNNAMVEYLECEMLNQKALAVFKESYRYEFNSKGVLDFSQK
jgi:ankyrin repeat protein